MISLADILSSITTFVGQALNWVDSFADAIIAEPLLLAFTIVSFVGLGVGLIKRIIRM